MKHANLPREPVTANRLRAAPNAKVLTDLAIERLKPRDRQFVIWDKSQKGLGVLISPSGTRSFISQYKLNGRWRRRNLGRFGEVAEDDGGEDHNLAWARARVREDRRLAKDGVDPQAVAPKPDKATFEAVLADFVELYCKPRQKTWSATENVLRHGCKTWMSRPFSEITRRDAYELLEPMVAAGRAPVARLTCSWIRTMWRWATRTDRIAANTMDGLHIDVEHRSRDRTYSDDELQAIWKAADTLSPVEAVYFKLLMLLAPRKNELAKMRRSHLDADLAVWTTPAELTKTKKTSKPRTYITPLPRLAQRILKPLLPKDDAECDLVFPGARNGISIDPGTPLKNKLIEAGAPDDFTFHAFRHTAATWLGNQGHDDFDQKLVLNHVLTSGATSSYAHGFAVDRKLALLEKWSDHVEGLVTAWGVVRLR